ncbi:hypothetical protein, conserved, partial [Trypanosoma vivax Y486]
MSTAVRSSQECEALEASSLLERVDVGLTPAGILEEMRILLLLRQELRNTHEDPDGEAYVAVPLEPHRTVDAKSLNVLRAPNFPFSICDEAPLVFEAPVPYNVEKEVNELQEKVHAFERIFRNLEDLSDAVVVANDVAGGRGAKSNEEQMRLFASIMSREPSFVDVARAVSVLRWYSRWVASHSLCCLCEVQEQLEYVLAEFGMPTESQLLDAQEQMTFHEAINILEKDRYDVVQRERRRLRSAARSYRNRVPLLSIVTGGNSFLDTEEKYQYQEYYNQTEYLMLLLHHTIQTGRVSQQGPVLQLQSPEEKDHKSVEPAEVVTTSGERGVEDTKHLAEATMKALLQERGFISRLLRVIHLRQSEGMELKVSDARMKESRLAALVVYNTVVGHVAMIREHLRLAKEFLIDYDEWVQYRSGGTTDEVVRQIGLSETFVPLAMSLPEFEQRPRHGLPGPSKEVHTSLSALPSQSCSLCDLSEEVSDTLVKLLWLIKSGHDPEEDVLPSCGERFRVWICVTLRYFCIQVVRGAWAAEQLLRCLDDVASVLLGYAADDITDFTAEKADVRKMIAALRCLLILVVEGAAVSSSPRDSIPSLCGSTSSFPSQSPMSRGIDVSLPLYATGDLDTVDEKKIVDAGVDGQWGAFFEAIWFQADPTGSSHSGFLIPPDLSIQQDKGFGFFRITYVLLPKRQEMKDVPPAACDHAELLLTVHYATKTGNLTLAQSPVQSLKEALSSASIISRTTRFTYARRVLQVFSILEQRGLLAKYACEISNAELAPLVDIIYLFRYSECSRQSGESSIRPRARSRRSSVTLLTRTPKRSLISVGLIPPPAVQLMRYEGASPSMCGPLSGGEI